MSTIQVCTRHATDDEVREVVRSRRALTPEAAVTIAAWWQSPGSIGHVLAGFASGCEVDRDELLDDIDNTRYSEPIEPADATDLARLSQFVASA